MTLRPSVEGAAPQDLLRQTLLSFRASRIPPDGTICGIAFIIVRGVPVIAPFSYVAHESRHTKFVRRSAQHRCRILLRGKQAAPVERTAPWVLPSSVPAPRDELPFRLSRQPITGSLEIARNVEIESSCGASPQCMVFVRQRGVAYSESFSRCASCSTRLLRTN